MSAIAATKSTCSSTTGGVGGRQPGRKPGTTSPKPPMQIRDFRRQQPKLRPARPDLVLPGEERGGDRSPRPGRRNFAFRRRQQSFPLGLLAGELAGAADGLGLLADSPFRRLLVGAALFHFPEHAFTLHLLLQNTKRLINIVFANQNLHELSNRVREGVVLALPLRRGRDKPAQRRPRHRAAAARTMNQEDDGALCSTFEPARAFPSSASNPRSPACSLQTR